VSVPTLVTGLAYVVGVGLGTALAARLKGAVVAAGRLCPRCGTSLSPVAAVPILSWFGVLPHCRTCGLPAPAMQAALETGVVLIGLLALVALPMPWALLAGAAGFGAFVLAVRRWG
jgi:prepilin signal peptidase PulO-like enzyme (type II secretory pathway)